MVGNAAEHGSGTVTVRVRAAPGYVCQDERLIVGFPGPVLTSGGLGSVSRLLLLLEWGTL